MAERMEAAAQIAAIDAGRNLERQEIIAFLELAVDEADEKMLGATCDRGRRNFAAASVAIQYVADLIRVGEHRNDDHV